jgi:hypothetical protein
MFFYSLQKNHDKRFIFLEDLVSTIHSCMTLGLSSNIIIAATLHVHASTMLVPTVGNCVVGVAFSGLMYIKL